jgi:prepilin-type processing-associated H-X9-DG protein
MREKLPTPASNGTWVRAYAFADGHSEIHAAPTPDGFADWEKERMVGGAPASEPQNGN